VDGWMDVRKEEQTLRPALLGRLRGVDLNIQKVLCIFSGHNESVSATKTEIHKTVIHLMKNAKLSSIIFQTMNILVV